MGDGTKNPIALDDPAATAALLALARQFLVELHPGAPRSRALTLDSSLEQDLGLDSLSRVELASRIERAFGIAVSEATLGRAATLGDLCTAPPHAFAASPASPAAAPPLAGSEAAAPAAESAATLMEVLDGHLRTDPDRIQIVHLDDDGETNISYRDLGRRTDAIAAGLQRAGLEPRQTVAIMLPTSPEYFHAFFGILRAGGIPVPIYPPARLSQIEEHVRRHAGILANARTSILITVPEARGVARLLEARVADLRRIVTVDQLATEGDTPRPLTTGGEEIALIQYTSGSTDDPKGVVLTHANLLANIRAMGQATGLGPRDVVVSWLPLYHDMGLISAWLASLYFATPLVVMSPLAFLAHPERWLQAIQRYRGTISAAPNFAYELCVKRIDDAQIEGLDLGSWRLAANGAEPVNPATLRRFAARFAPHGFRPQAMTPVYGLAECTVGLLCPPLGREPRIDRVRREDFSRAGRAVPAANDDAESLCFVSCGRPLPGHEVRIVDALGNEVGERIEGRLEFRGPSATSGYYRNPEQTRRLRHGDWLDSGDRAYAAAGEIHITGRVKDVIIRRGHNIHPHEVENAVGAIAGIRRGCVAVFGAPAPESGTERLVVLAETNASEAAAREALRAAIVAATIAVLGEPPDDVVLAPPHTILKTSSGKIRRAASRQLYEAGDIGARQHAPWWQVVRLVTGTLLPWTRRLAIAGAHFTQACYVWLLFGLLAIPAWLLTAAAVDPKMAWRLNRLVARLFLRLAGIPLTVLGLEQMPRQPCVLVANHASYADALILCAALPARYGFVAKRELLDHPLTGVYLRRLGTQFVERFDTRQSIEDIRRLGEKIRSGISMAFFPEGTFTRTTGLAPFRLGAFVVAATARVAVLPVAINGSRSLLRDGQWLPQRGPILVTLGTPLPPPAAADVFTAAVALRDGARAHILAHCGEPDIDASRAPPSGAGEFA